MQQQQLDIAVALERGHSLAACAAEKADRLSPWWIARACEAVRAVVRRTHREEEFTVETVRHWVEKMLDDPPDAPLLLTDVHRPAAVVGQVREHLQTVDQPLELDLRNGLLRPRQPRQPREPDQHRRRQFHVSHRSSVNKSNVCYTPAPPSRDPAPRGRTARGRLRDLRETSPDLRESFRDLRESPRDV